MKKLNVGVIGIGNLGQHHARIYYSMSNVKLTAIVDVDSEKINKYKTLYPDAEFFQDYREAIPKADVFSVVVPTKYHFSISKDLLLAGKHVLIEKPITTTLQEAEELISIAKQNNLIIQVGHVERFNPVVQSLKNYITHPVFIESTRLSSFDPRVADVGVVLDLMIHDIDIILCFVKSKLCSVESYGAKVFTDKEDIVKARLRFENGCVCDLTASRISPTKYRKMRIFQPDSYLSLDFMRQQAKIYKKKKSEIFSMSDIELIRPKIKREEPLKLELESFVNSVLEKRRPVVTGEEAKDALSVAIEIVNQIKINERK